MHAPSPNRGPDASSVAFRARRGSVEGLSGCTLASGAIGAHESTPAHAPGDGGVAFDASDAPRQVRPIRPRPTMPFERKRRVTRAWIGAARNHSAQARAGETRATGMEIANTTGMTAAR